MQSHSIHNHCRTSLLALIAFYLLTSPALAGGPPANPSYKVLPPIVRSNLAIYPLLAGHSYDTSQLLTLDEGIRSGQVTITEHGEQPALFHPGQEIRPIQQGAEVNRLLLYNNSKKPLLLLAGEIVTGGKQDRIVGSDRIVPPESGPLDLNVFCVEPGRWTGAKPSFGSLSMQMAQPDVRAPAMAERNQEMVWNSVRGANARAMGQVAGVAPELHGTTSYAKVFSSAPMQKALSGYGGSESEQSILKELRGRNAVGVVVAVGDRIIWADIFASTDLLAKYWPKLMNSYVAEAMTAGQNGKAPSADGAQLWVNHLTGQRETAETEPGLYRRTDITGEGYRVFELESLLPGTDFPVHITKIREQYHPTSELRPGPIW